VIVFVVGLSIAGVLATVKTGEPPWLFLSMPFTVMVFFAARFAPAGYRLDGDGLHVERKAGDRVIPYRAILAVDRDVRQYKGVSLLASKGIFGYFGRFWNSTLGFYRLFVTDTEAIVWLRTTDGLVGVSPDRPDEFVERLGAKLAPSR
jgi:hypothetical protein